MFSCLPSDHWESLGVSAGPFLGGVGEEMGGLVATEAEVVGGEEGGVRLSVLLPPDRSVALVVPACPSYSTY